MDYKIEGLYPDEFQFVAENVPKFDKNKSHQLVAMDTRLIAYKKNQLTIGTVYNMVVLNGEEKTHIGSIRYGTSFIFMNESLLTRGTTKKAIAAIQDCIDLSQAHAFAAFCYHAEHKLGIDGIASSLLPRGLYSNEIHAFLMKHNKIRMN